MPLKAALAGAAAGVAVGCERSRSHRRLLGFWSEQPEKWHCHPCDKGGLQEGRCGEERKNPEFHFKNTKCEMFIRHLNEDVR